MSEAEVEVQERPTLYTVITEIAGFAKDENKTVDEFKMDLVRHFDEEYPEEEDFNDLPEEVQNWLNDAAGVAKKNRGATKQKPLPHLEGLDAEAIEAAPKRRGRKVKDPSEKKVKVVKAKEKKERGPSRYVRTMRVMMANPDLSAEEMANKADIAQASAGYCYDAWKAAKLVFEEAGYIKS